MASSNFIQLKNLSYIEGPSFIAKQNMEKKRIAAAIKRKPPRDSFDTEEETETEPP
jgi:hypothetical protein